MSKRFIQDGKTLDFVTAGVVAADAVVAFTHSIGIALAPATGAGQTIPVAMEGVVELPKETGVVFAPGQKLYWDVANSRVDATNTNVPCGICWRAQLSGDTVCLVKLNAGAPV